MAYVVKPVTLPASLVGVPNGKLPDDLLVSVGPSGRLHETAARAWRALCAEAKKSNFDLIYTFGGTYRTYAQQEVLFRSRYSPTGTFGGCKTWNGVKWCLKGNYAMAAVPGTSNHGLGLAIDSALDLDPSDGPPSPEDAVSIMPAIGWMVANCLRFGFSWEAQSEPWHIRYTPGDVIPQAVLDYEESIRPKPPVTPPPDPDPEEDDDMALPIAAMYVPENLPAGMDKYFGLRADGGIRHLSGPDVDYCRSRKPVPVEEFPITSPDHYTQLEANSKQGL